MKKEASLVQMRAAEIRDLLEETDVSVADILDALSSTGLTLVPDTKGVASEAYLGWVSKSVSR
jgi:hypothetical protein